MQTVRQLDQQHAQVLAHGEQELAQVFRRALVLGHHLDLGELGDAIDQPRNVGAEELLDLLDRGQRIFHGIVEQRGDDRLLIELQLGHQARNLDRVAEIRIARGAFLGSVLLYGVNVSTVEQGFIGLGRVFLDAFDEFVLAQHFQKSMSGFFAARQGGTATSATFAHETVPIAAQQHLPRPLPKYPHAAQSFAQGGSP